MLLRVFVLAIAMLFVTPSTDASADIGLTTVESVAAATPADTTPPADTINDFFPESRSLGDCLSSVPRPGCGSKAQGGWRQTLVFGLLVGGLAFITWRIVVQSRKARA